MYKYEFNNLIRVNKKAARRLYNEGCDVLFIPCKVDPYNMWGIGSWVHHEYDFDRICNNFIYYNCDKELGVDKMRLDIKISETNYMYCKRMGLYKWII